MSRVVHRLALCAIMACTVFPFIVLERFHIWNGANARIQSGIDGRVDVVAALRNPRTWNVEILAETNDTDMVAQRLCNQNCCMSHHELHLWGRPRLQSALTLTDPEVNLCLMCNVYIVQ